MTVFSLTFPAFLLGLVCLYYIVPKRFQWLVLLAGSLVFYLWNSLAGLAYLLFVAGSTYLTGRILSGWNETLKAMDRQSRSAVEGQFRKKKRLVLTLNLVAMFGLLYVVKYWNDTASVLEQLSGGRLSNLKLHLLMPLGLSFYMFQSAGYSIDCYRGKYKAEKNFLKYLLFASFFPQMIQGPISRHNELGPQLTDPHPWNPDTVKYGIQRMLWGYLKKMVIADRAAAVVSAVFADLGAYGGAVYAFAILFYSIQLYCDFSGGIDIAIGAAELFGISVTENFRRPLFALTLAEYWRRWHITLGAWMRDYVFYPISMSKAFGRLGRFSRKHIRGKAGKVVPTALATFIVYFLIGVWHGANFRYIAYGLWYGSLLTGSVLMKNTFESMRTRLKIDSSKAWFRIFQMMRTTAIVFIGRYITGCPRLMVAIRMLWKTVTSPCLYQLKDGTFWNLGLGKGDYLVVAVGMLVLLTVELLQERGIKIRKSLEEKPAFVQFLFLFIPLLCLLIFGILKDSALNAAFIYQQY